MHKEVNQDIKSGTKFKVGDIVQYKNNPRLRYVVTALSKISGEPTWIGLSTTGRTNGGTIEGSWNFEDYEVIGTYPLYKMYKYIEECENTNGTKK